MTWVNDVDDVGVWFRRRVMTLMTYVYDVNDVCVMWLMTYHDVDDVCI